MEPDGKCHRDMERTQVEWHGGQKGWHRGKRTWKVEETGGGKRLVREENTSLEWGDLEEEGHVSKNKGEKKGKGHDMEESRGHVCGSEI
jgi:hypothetical protein